MQTGSGTIAKILKRNSSGFDFINQLRKDEGLNRRRGGVGLGMAIVKQLVEAMEGEIRVASRPGRGSSFSIFLPYRPMSNAASAAEEVLGEPFEGESRHILLVEDNEVNRLLIKALLEKAGHLVTDCGDGQEALDRRSP